jgi:ATP-dependent Zn protease
MVLYRWLSTCIVLIATCRESFAYLSSRPVCSLSPVTRNHFPIDSRFKLSSSAPIQNYVVSNPGNKPTPDQPKGPFRFIKRIALLTMLLIKLNSLKALSGVSSAIGAVKKVIKDPKSSPNSKVSHSKKSKLNSKIIQNLGAIIKKPRFWIQLFAAGFSFTIFRKYLAFTKSLTTELSYATFLNLISTAPERVASLRVTPSSFMFLLDGKSALTRMVKVDPLVMTKLLASGIDFAAPPTPTNVLGILWTLAYAGFLWNVSTKMMQGPQDEGAGKRKDKAGDLDAYGKLSFEDVAGQERAMVEVREVCEMLQGPEKYLSVGARLPSGVLLVGPPGTGKTLLARVAAAEAGVPFYACSASDFVEVFVGRGPARVRKLFKQAADNAPCIVFIDEIDSIGRSRRMGSMNSEQENTLNQILTCMDGLDTSNNGVIVMGATNRFELLDPALLRSGRFDRIVQCPLPDIKGRTAILKVHTRKLKLNADVDLEKIAKFTPGTCGADLSAISNEGMQIYIKCELR